MKLIVAVDERWGIGKDGDLLTSIPEDMQYYIRTTRGKAVVMGYNTLISLPGSKPAPGRMNIVINNAEGCVVPGAVVCDSMDQLLRLAACFEPDEIFVIGGGSIYRQLMPYCADAHITKMRFDGDADTFIPDLDELPEWQIANESELYDHEGLQYSFVVYHNSKPLPLPAISCEHNSAMSAYFRKKENTVFSLIDCEGYTDAFIKLLRAYYAPIGQGFSAKDTAAFLEDGTKSLEQYLKDNGYIAAFEDFEKLRKQFDHEGEYPAYSVRVEKAQADEFIAFAATHSAAETAKEYAC